MKTHTLAPLVLLLGAGAAQAADPALQKVSLHAVDAPRPAAATAIPDGTLVFTAAPRESVAAGEEIYGPVAAYLSQVTGRNVVYRHPGNWLSYQTEMKKGSYDLVFDGPHFNGWRANRMKHNVLVRAPGNQSFVVVAKKGNDRVNENRDLAGRPLCGMSPPNLGSIMVLRTFDNPAREPVLVPSEGWQASFNGMVTGRCTAAIVPTTHLAKFDPNGTLTKVIYRGDAVPNQALSAGPRVSAEDQTKIALALTAPQARTATAKLREAFAVTGDLVPAVNADYVRTAGLLKDAYGYH